MIESIPQYEGLNVTFVITEDCNLACSYCYEVDKKPNDLPLEYAKMFIRHLIDDKDPIGVTGTKNDWIIDRGLVLDFIGGDALMRPQLCWDILNYFMYYSNSKNHKWSTRWRGNISSNGTLLGRKKVRDFLMHFTGNISLGISIDGCPEIHDMNRKYKNGEGSMKDILKNWDWYLNYVGPYIAATKSTMNSLSIPYLYKSLKFMHEELGLQQVNQNFMFEKMDPEPDLKEFDKQMGKCIEYVLDHRKDLFWSLIRSGLVNSCEMDKPDKGWCGAGSMPTLAPNGKIYPCFRFAPHTMYDRENYDLSVGDVWNGFDRKDNFEIVRKQTRLKVSPEKCVECNVESQCPFCIGFPFSESGKFYRTTNHCELHKLQVKWAKIYWEEYNKLEKN